jgi:hypothetical protein
MIERLRIRHIQVIVELQRPWNLANLNEKSTKKFSAEFLHLSDDAHDVEKLMFAVME